MKIICSQIGYDIGAPKRVLLAGEPAPNAVFCLTSVVTGEVTLEGKIVYWGEKWQENWYTADLTALDVPGDYVFTLQNGEESIEAPCKIRIGHDLLWNQTWHAVSLEQLDVRKALAYRPEGGWKDCGSTLQEVSSHVIMLTALCELLEHPYLPAHARESVLEQLLTGADYVLVCQRENGGFVHEQRCNGAISTGNCINASMTLARISRLVRDLCTFPAGIMVTRRSTATRQRLPWSLPRHFPMTRSARSPMPICNGSVD